MEKHFFDLLKQQIEQMYKVRYADCTEAINDWKGKEIRRFQADLSQHAQGQVSEKWFYTYFKTQPAPEKLPRIDVLNLLAIYVGYEGWEDFVQKNTPTLPQATEKTKVAAVSMSSAVGLFAIEEKSKTLSEENKTSNKSFFSLAAMGFALLLVVALIALQWKSVATTNKYSFCVIDADTKQPIEGATAQWLKEQESPVLLTATTSGNCLQLSAMAAHKVRLAVTAPYYRTDTIVRQLPEQSSSETIALRADDYALMLRYFDKSEVKDWKKRREQLSLIFAEEAQIIQVYGEAEGGVELYNKAEFIDKLTMPLESLRGLEVLHTAYNRQGKIIELRFK